MCVLGSKSLQRPHPFHLPSLKPYVHLFTGFLVPSKLFIKETLGERSQEVALVRTSLAEHV